MQKKLKPTQDLVVQSQGESNLAFCSTTKTMELFHSTGEEKTTHRRSTENGRFLSNLINAGYLTSGLPEIRHISNQGSHQSWVLE